MVSRICNMNKRTVFILGAAATVFLVIRLVLIDRLHLQSQAYFDKLQESEWLALFRHHSDVVEEVEEPVLSLEGSLSLSAIHDIVKSANGYLVRDWSMWLGWNNLRYNIEAAVLHAELLNRVLVLPTYIYARGCEFNIPVYGNTYYEFRRNSCAAYFEMLNKNDAFENDDGRDLPEAQQMTWRIPISMMLDLPRLRARHPTILVSDFLRIHDLPESYELAHPKGFWDRERYHEGNYIFSSPHGIQTDNGRPSLYVVHNDWYDDHIARVDYLTTAMKSAGGYDLSITDPERDRVGGFRNTAEDSKINQRLMAELEDDRKMDWDRAKQIIEEEGTHLYSDEHTEEVLRANGWEVLYTYAAHGGMDYMKTVTDPIYQTAPRARLRGLKDDFGSIREDVLLFEGEIHLYRKPGLLEFSTSDARSAFTDLVLNYIVPPPKVYKLATILTDKMSERVGGRLWMGAHMRRGDFALLGWAMESSLEAHLERIKKHLEEGRQILINLHDEQEELQISGARSALPENQLLSYRPPEEDAPFYLATDERDPKNLEYLASHGAVLISSLIAPHDRREFGAELLITDVLALVEQVILSKADYFYGHVMSSVAGGVVNMRMREGKDSRTFFAD